MRRERLYLNDIIEAAASIATFISGATHDSFVGDDLVRSAVLHKLQVIGEAAAHVSEDLRSQSPEVPWPQVVGFRNITVHAYFAVDWDIVWTTATEDTPSIAAAVRKLIAKLPSDETAR